VDAGAIKVTQAVTQASATAEATTRRLLSTPKLPFITASAQRIPPAA
jgi:hypothetical protein